MIRMGTGDWGSVLTRGEQLRGFVCDRRQQAVFLAFENCGEVGRGLVIACTG